MVSYDPPRGEKEAAEVQLLYEELKSHGVDFATGVPCGGQEGVIYYLIEDDEITHVHANREAEAIGIAAGARMSGRTPVVYMQNSGLFGSSNEIASLLLAYDIPLLLSVTWRGCPGENTPQHQITGSATKDLLDSLGVPFRIIDEDNTGEILADLFARIRDEQVTAALLIPRRWYQ